MEFSEIIGLDHIKSHLQTTVKTGRVAHAQLFVGQSGCGLLPLAIAYAKELLCSNHKAQSGAYAQCAAKVAHLSHPDLHFVYPINSNETIKKNPLSDSFSDEWRKFVLKNPYGSLFQWYQQLGIENKQGVINVKEAEEISKKLSLKAYEGGYKIMIIWMAEKMNTECTNKILKLVEEPPQNTVLLLLTENEGQLLNTIHSRCQILHIPLLSEQAIVTSLKNKTSLPENELKKIGRQARGDFNRALQLLEQGGDEDVFESWFVQWVRTAFKAKGNKKAIQELLQWSDMMAGSGREVQKNFLSYCIELFRQALLKNYRTEGLIDLETKDPKFSIEKFAPFVHQNNIFEILSALENAIFHIERNGNAKIIFTDLSIQLTRFIHEKELA